MTIIWISSDLRFDTLVNNHVDNYLEKNLAFAYYDSIVNNRHKNWHKI